jgi:SAM-dependent methyltransferase
VILKTLSLLNEFLPRNTSQTSKKGGTMAVFIIRSEAVGGPDSITERIEVRPWRLGGKSHQDFVIGSGANFNASGNILVEIIYSINDVQFFYTRNFLHYIPDEVSVASLEQSLEAFKVGVSDAFGFGDMLPETAVILRRNKHTYENNGEEQTYISYRLLISADISAGIGMDGPGSRMINIEIDVPEPEQGLEFMRQLVCEIGDVHQEQHPNPASLPAGSSDWSFVWQVNQRAYDQIAVEYKENYFSEPLLMEMFDTWLSGIPSGGQILDVGCGHGQPVIGRLLEKGYRVTGADLSPAMLERACQHFPTVRFINQLAAELNMESEFDGACSLSSLLYLDPIDLSHSLHRLHRALKPGGLLFLHAYDLHPSFRGRPYHVDIKQWMWGWTYGMDEAVQALEEHRFFRVLRAQDVTSQSERQEHVEKWYKQAQEEREAFLKDFPHAQYPAPDRHHPPRLMYKYVIVAQALETGHSK